MVLCQQHGLFFLGKTLENGDLDLQRRVVQRNARLQGNRPGCCRKVHFRAGVKNRPRGINHHRPALRRLHRGHRIAPLCAHARNQQRQRWRNRPHALNLLRARGPHHQAQLAIGVPRPLRQLGNVLKQRRLAGTFAKVCA